jgi:ureidoglycolate lyase
MKSVKAEALTSEAFSEFGDVIECREGQIAPINGGTCLKFGERAALELCAEEGRPAMHIYRVNPLPSPVLISSLERHNHGSQAFVPLDNRPYLVVVAPRGDLDAQRIRVFLASGEQGVNYRPGTWHHFCLALEEASHFLVVDRVAPEVDCDEFRLAIEHQFTIGV